MRFNTEVLTRFPAERSAQGKGCFAFIKISSLCLLWIPWHCSIQPGEPQAVGSLRKTSVFPIKLWDVGLVQQHAVKFWFEHSNHVAFGGF